MSFKEQCENVKRASLELSMLNEDKKNEILLQFANELKNNIDELKEANNSDIQEARTNGMNESFIDRLTLNEKRIDAMIQGIKDIVSFNDPIGEVIEKRKLECGLKLKKVRVPIGVVGIIFESRPNVTADSIAICIKSGNACILRGGKESVRSNKVIADTARHVLSSMDLNMDTVLLVEDTTRETTAEMMKMRGQIDVIIPRGGKGLIDYVVTNSLVPVIETGAGNCHVYVDATADIDMAVSVTLNAKISRPSVCNSAETLLVHKDIAQTFLPLMAEAFKKNNVVIRGCEETMKLLSNNVVLATESDWQTEYNDFIMAVKVVPDINAAVKHIQKYSTHHSESIITSNEKAAEYFTRAVDSAAVYVNASTRFTDGGVFGLGSEIGISTQKLHARGPMGLKELTSYKYILEGNGQIR